MLLTRVIPCLLLRGNGLVKTEKFTDEKYIGDPINAVKIFNEKEVDELIFLDITATPEGRGPRLELIQEIAGECFMPLCYGGGISDLNQMESIFTAGVEKVCINSAAIKNPELVKQASDIYGAQSIVVSIDVKKNLFGHYTVSTDRGKKSLHKNPVEYAKQMEDMGAGEIFINSVNLDGTRKGYDIDLVSQVSGAVSVPTIACGGAGELADFKKAIESGASAVSAGSFFVFHGKHKAVLITYPEIGELENILQS